MQRRTFLQGWTVSLAGAPLFAQGDPRFRPASPPLVATATIGGKPVKIDYFAPSMRGRKVYGGLVPYGEIWCPGANWSTAFTSSEAGIEIGPMKLAKGSYALWVIPGEKEFELIVNSNSHAFHLDHDASTDIGRTKMMLKTLEKPVEQLTFEIRPDGGNKGTIALIWENTEATIGFTLT
ncbi:MAG: DUF2911 domain-containing protein [Bryobacteraceae bacterium]